MGLQGEVTLRTQSLKRDWVPQFRDEIVPETYTAAVTRVTTAVVSVNAVSVVPYVPGFSPVWFF